GLNPGDRPFFTAKRLSVAMDWKALAARRPDVSITSVELTDWRMLVEKWENVQSFPRLVRKDDEPSPGGPKASTTTLHYLRASRGEFVFEDHETPWGIVCPNLDLTITN